MSSVSEDMPRVLLLSGFDPSGGAGMIADVKACEYCGVLPQGVITSNTIQLEDKFMSLGQVDSNWREQLTQLLGIYKFNSVKIGLVPDLSFLVEALRLIRAVIPEVFIVWDPVLRATHSGENIHQGSHSDLQSQLHQIFNWVDLVTPNGDEAKWIQDVFNSSENSQGPLLRGAELFKTLNTSFLLKSTHHEVSKGLIEDVLIQQSQSTTIQTSRIEHTPKRGTGCTLSSLIACAISKNTPLVEACSWAQSQMENYLISNSSPLGSWSRAHEIK
jgi:hydroxymethylpyrimidine/phosphomethylpyrimidine kinase